MSRAPSRRPVSLAALPVALLIATIASAQPASTRQAGQQPYVLRLGYTTFERPETVHTDSTLHSLGSYLRLVSRQSQGTGPWKRPLQFDVMLGNYYQVWSWFRSGQIDAAVVSPFMAFLLERDTESVSVLEFSEQGDPAGHKAYIAASGQAGSNPLQAFDEYLDKLLAAAKVGSLTSGRSVGKVDALRAAYRVNLVSHLSSSGFVLPSLHAKQWLASREATADESNRFWHIFFENMRLTLAHGITPARTSATEFYFSYDGRSPDRLRSEAAANGLGDWQEYAPAPFKKGEPSIPNDVLVVRRQVVTDALGIDATDRTVLGDYLTTAAMQAPFENGRGSYTSVRWFNTSIHGRFRAEVDRLFGPAAAASLAERNERWYQRGLFDFTLGETMAFLRQDQDNSNEARLSLVLSGGGVKSLYQTVLLDHLYGLEPAVEPMIRNFDEGPRALSGPTPRNSDGPLTVHTIIGTSGGAMLAFFAAQLPAVSATERTLTAILSRTAALPLFPRFDLARVASVMLLLSVLVLSCVAARITNRFGYGVMAYPVAKSGVPGTSVAGVALLAMGAAVIVLTRSEHIETVPGAEGTLFALTALGVHFWITCVGRATAARPDEARGALALVTILFGALLVFFAVVARFAVGSGPNAADTLAKIPLSLAASGGVFAVVAGLIGAADAGRWRLGIHDARDYGAALFVVAAFIVVAYVPAILLDRAGWASLLELTFVFWLTLAASAIVTAILLLWLASRWREHERLGLIHLGVVSLMRSRTGAMTTTVGGTLLALSAWAYFLWIVLIAPALYGNVEALGAMSGALTEAELQTNRFRTNLVVTGSLLNDVPCGTDRVRQGGVYFCFEGAEGCGSGHRGQWQVFRRPSPARAIDAVFASGSAFPVFPQHLANLPNGCEVRLVDGGYAHNVPLEAAAQAESRQVLILNASPDPDTGGEPPGIVWRVLAWLRLDGSQLVTNSPKLLSFMFNRAQELDRNHGGSMVVASITPRPAGGRWPFLLDFRESVRKTMIETARQDIRRDHRIGNVLSWGRPVTLTRITPAPGDLPSPPGGWSERAQGVLDRELADPGAGRVAAFDLDNTCLHGDIGEAMFLKMVVELRYDGASEAFWQLIPDAHAREELKAYWKRFNAEPRKSYTRPVTWGAAFTDYVVLFLRQYEHLEAGAGGAREAYRWVVRLLGGLPPAEAERMAVELWNEEMRRPIHPVTIRSAAHGVLQLAGGVRVRQEFRRLIGDLRRRGWEVWIVSASNVYAVQAAARVLGVPADRVLAMTPVTSGGFITSRLNEPVPYREGKRELLRQAGAMPRLAAGDSLTDLEMLQASRTVILVDRGRIPQHELGADWIRELPATFRLESPRLPDR